LPALLRRLYWLEVAAAGIRPGEVDGRVRILLLVGISFHPQAVSPYVLFSRWPHAAQPEMTAVAALLIHTLLLLPIQRTKPPNVDGENRQKMRFFRRITHLQEATTDHVGSDVDFQRRKGYFAADVEKTLNSEKALHLARPPAQYMQILGNVGSEKLTTIV